MCHFTHYSTANGACPHSSYSTYTLCQPTLTTATTLSNPPSSPTSTLATAINCPHRTSRPGVLTPNTTLDYHACPLCVSYLQDHMQHSPSAFIQCAECFDLPSPRDTFQGVGLFFHSSVHPTAVAGLKASWTEEVDVEVCAARRVYANQVRLREFQEFEDEEDEEDEGGEVVGAAMGLGVEVECVEAGRGPGGSVNGAAEVLAVPSPAAWKAGKESRKKWVKPTLSGLVEGEIVQRELDSPPRYARAEFDWNHKTDLGW